MNKPIIIPPAQLDTPNAHDLTLLTNAQNSRGLIAIPLGKPDDPPQTRAVERAIIKEWLQLIDIQPSMVAMAMGQPPQPVVLRIFRLTGRGRARLAQLRININAPVADIA